MRDNTQNKQLAEKLFPNVKNSVEEIIEKYPKRKLEDTQLVLRFAPSPTGFVHIGTIYTSLINKKLSDQTDGIFILRIEDTDKKREVENGVKTLVEGIKGFGIEIDEGATEGDKYTGEYGPYVQSERMDIYKTFAKDLVSKGLAYPCFATEQDLEEIRNKQNELGVKTGYYGEWAKWRNASLEDIEKELEKETPFVIRLYSQGNSENQINIKDLIKGALTIRENDMDAVLLKSDGLPTYHFAHPIDDILMDISFVLRGDEWYSSVPLHMEIFKALGFEQIQYGHLAPMMKIDEETKGKRKLSKRKDPEADIAYYISNGYPITAVKEYLLNIANSNFSDWRIQFPEKEISEFNLKLEKFNKAGALFDIIKLENICKDYIAKLTAQQVYDQALEWSKEHDKDLNTQMSEHKDYFIRIFNIEREGNKVRKDIGKWNDIRNHIDIFFENTFKEITIPEVDIKPELQKNIISDFIDTYYPGDTVEEWFGKVKNIATKNNFCTDHKEYKENPSKYNGKVGDIAMILRIATTHKQQTPDLYQIMQVLGEEEVINRLKNYTESI